MLPHPLHRDNPRQIKSSEATGLTFHRAGEGKTTSELWRLMLEMLATAAVNHLCLKMVVISISSYLLQVNPFFFFKLNVF